MLMFVITSIGFAVMNMRMFKIIPPNVLILLYVGILLTTLSFIALFVLISCSISNRAISAILCLLLIIGLYTVSYEVYDITNQEEYFHAIERDPVTGQVYFTDELIPNSKYVGGPIRAVLDVVNDTLPLGQFMQYGQLFNPMFRFETIEVAVVSDKAMNMLYTLPFYSLGLIIILFGSGYIIFRKKDFK